MSDAAQFVSEQLLKPEIGKAKEKHPITSVSGSITTKKETKKARTIDWTLATQEKIEENRKNAVAKDTVSTQESWDRRWEEFVEQRAAYNVQTPLNDETLCIFLTGIAPYYKKKSITNGILPMLNQKVDGQLYDTSKFKKFKEVKDGILKKKASEGEESEATIPFTKEEIAKIFGLPSNAINLRIKMDVVIGYYLWLQRKNRYELQYKHLAIDKTRKIITVDPRQMKNWQLETAGQNPPIVCAM